MKNVEQQTVKSSKYMLRATKWAITLLAIGLCMRPHLQAQTIEIANAVQLKGQLGTKLNIEMYVQTNEGVPFFKVAGKDSINLVGYYVYRSQLLPIAIKGALHPANGGFSIDAYDASMNVAERFVGKWEPTAKRLKGNWTLLATEKSMPFVLTATEAGLSAANIQAYYRFLRDQLQGNVESAGDAEGAVIGDAQWTAQEGTITDFTPSWHGGLTFFSPTRLEFYTGYNSTARSSYYEHLLQLLPSKTGVYGLYYRSSSNYDKYYNEEGIDDEGEHQCGYTITIYQLIADEFEDVTAKVWPANIPFDTGYDNRNLEGSACTCRLISDGIRLDNGERLWWDGSKFVTQQ